MKRFKCLILLFICVLWVCQGFEPVFADDFDLPENFKISRYFSYYGFGSGPGIDWQALNDPNNNPILKDCLVGTTAESLCALGIRDLYQRLERLEQSNLIKKIDEKYQLAFPSIVGKKRAKLRKIVEDCAIHFLPTVEKMIEQIRPSLGGHEEMLYQVLWSVIMDGPVAWQTASQILKQQIKHGDISFNHKSWLLYPRHPLRCGTNTYGLPYGQLRITHSPNMFRVVRPDISEPIKQAAQAIKERRPVASESTKQILYEYGLVDISGKPKIFTIKYDPNNLEVIQLYTKLGQQFGEEIILNSDIAKVAETLDVELGIAFLVVYHEICYELLHRLVEKKLLDVPAIGTTDDISEVYRLVSLVIVPEGVNFEQIINKCKDGSGRATEDNKQK